MTIFKKRSEAMTSDHLRRMVISAMFLALALVMRTVFRAYIPIFGESGMRISIHVIFSAMPAILFGPIYGAIVAGLSDFIGFHLSPTGAWIPQLTLTAILGGFVRGGLWMILRDRNTALMRNCVVVISVLVLGIGVYNIAALSSDGVNRTFYDAYTLDLSVNDQGLPVRSIDHDRVNTIGMSIISRMAVTRTINNREPAEGLSEFITFVTITMIGIGIFGFLLILVDWAANKFIIKEQNGAKTMALLLAMMTAAILVNTLNTIFLRQTAFPAWQLLPFSVVWLPRVIQAAATTTIITYFVAMLLEICERQPHLRMWMK